MFQSTLPVWGATSFGAHLECALTSFNPRSPCGERRASGDLWAICDSFNPRSPCGERQVLFRVVRQMAKVSIHAPRVGSDSARLLAAGPRRHVSIHAPRVGSDSDSANRPTGANCFNPRSPCGERPRWAHCTDCSTGVSIHAPRVGSDANAGVKLQQQQVSIHAPRVGSDRLPK